MINKLLGKFGYTKKSSPFSSSAERFFSSPTNSYKIDNTQQQLNSYDNIAWVGHCVETRAEEIGSTEWGIFRGEGDRAVEVENTKAHILLEKPHPLMNTVHFLKTLVYHIDLTGNAFILKNINNKLAEKENRPAELIPWIPSNVRIIDEYGMEVTSETVKSGGYITDYELRDRGDVNLIKPDDIVQINAGSPYNMFRGMGIVQRNSAILESEKIQDMFDIAFLEKGVMLKMVITTEDQDMYGDEVQRANKEMRANLTGTGESLVVLPPGMNASFPDIKYSELQMLERSLQSKENITTIFRIPRYKVGLETRFRTIDGEMIEWERVKASLYSMIEEALTTIVEEINGDGYYFAFKRKEVIDFEKQLKKVQTGNFTVQQSQKLLGESVDENAPDIYVTTMNTIPYDEIGFSTPEPAPADNTKKSCGCGDEHVNKESESGFDQRRVRSKEKMRIHRLADRTKRKKIVPQIIKDTNAYYKQFESSVLDSFDEVTKSYVSKAVSADDVFNYPELRKEGLKSAQNMFTSSVVLGIEDNNAIYDTLIDASTKNAKLRLVVDKLSINYVDVTLNSRIKEMRSLFTKGVEEGLTIPELRENVTKYMDTLTDPSGFRAMRIARTEASNAWDEAAKLSFQDMGVKTFDVIGCEDNETDCNAVNVPMSDWDKLTFHPNHTGTRVANI